VPYVLGIDIGAGSTKAAVCRRADGPGPSGGGWGPAQPVALGVRSRTVSSALAMTEEGDVVPADYGRLRADGVGGYLHRVGDRRPMLFGGDWFPAHGLVAAMVRWIVERAWELLGEPPERLALAYPSSWGNGRLHLLHSALAETELGHTALVTRARAVVESHQAAGHVAAVAGPLLVYRIGGSTCEVAVVVPHGPGRFELLGCAELDEVSGFDLDGSAPLEARAMIRSTVDLAAHTVRGCGVTPGDLSAVLIAGGSETVYSYVSDQLSAAFPVTVLRDPDPPMTVAAGAALAVRPQPRRAAPPAPVPVSPSGGAPQPADLPTDSWPEIARGGPATAERPPRPPVHVGPVRVEPVRGESVRTENP
jgi:molecular chaperone DnaK (HSP70)